MRTIAFLFIAILIGHPAVARAQTGSATAMIPVAINEDSGCGQGKVAEVAPHFCDDFDVGKMSTRDKDVAAAKAKCVAFYSDALRAQNVFCSYQMDAVRFQVTSNTTAEAETVGQANVSESAVSTDNRNAATISRGYIIRFNSLAVTLKRRYQDYLVALDKLNAAGGADETFEANCSASNLRSDVPGTLRMMLAAFTWSNAQLSYNSMFGALRANMRKLKAMKDEAEKNAKLAEVRALEVGNVLHEEVTKDKPKDDTIPIPSETASSNPLVQYFANKTIQILGRKYGASIASSLGSGAILTGEISANLLGAGVMITFELATGQAVKVSDASLMFLGALQPETALAAAVLVQAHQRQQQVLEIYRKFVAEELSQSRGGNVAIKSSELMTIWGQRTKQPSCVSKAAQEAQCAQQRASNPPQAYDHGPCTNSGSATISDPSN